MSPTPRESPSLPYLPTISTMAVSSLPSLILKYVIPVCHCLFCNRRNLFFTWLFFVAACLYLEDLIHIRFLADYNINLRSVLSASCLIAFLAHCYFMSRPIRVYLVDFACYKPSPSCLFTKEQLVDRATHIGHLAEDKIALVKKIVDRSGLGPRTYVPRAAVEVPPEQHSMVHAREETETVLFGAIDELLEKTGIQAKDIGILVVNCCLFNPTPSLSDVVVNHYKLRGNIISYNLSGMGCSAAIIAIDFAKRLLQEHPNTYALVLSTENIISSLYWGNTPSMLLVNCLFRMGGSAALLSSHPSDRRRSKYQIIHTLRTHMGADDDSYNCVQQMEDEDQKVGVALSKDLMNVARDVLKVHITSLGPLVLPISEKLKYVANFVRRKLFKMKIEAYIPDFKSAFEHFCIHTGGRAVLDRMQKSLDLGDWHMEPSRMTLYRFGNTSSSSIWYELAYCEAKGRIKTGDRIWQMAFGSGFKCNTAVWVALNTVDPASNKNPWRDEIHDFPIST